MKRQFMPFLFGFSLILLTAAAVPSGKYHIINTIKLKGDTGWDYLTMDGKARLLYVTRGSHVAVIDTTKGVEVGEITGTDGVHGVALAEDLGRGFTSNGKTGTVTVFDLQSRKELAKVPTGKNPDAIVYAPSSQRVLAFNGGSKSVTVIDASKAKVTGTLELDGKPEFAAVDAAGKVFVNIEDKNLIVVIDPLKPPHHSFVDDELDLTS